MEDNENKRSTAMNALQKIRERVTPARDCADTPPKEQTVEEEYQGVRIIDVAGRGLVRMFFPHVPAENVRRYLKRSTGSLGSPASAAGRASGVTMRDTMQEKRWIGERGAFPVGPLPVPIGWDS